jgi:predicted transcriptional regulator
MADQLARSFGVEAKTAVRKVLDQLPDDCTLEDVQYHLYVLQQIENGQRDAAEGRTVPHDEIVRELTRKWLTTTDE